MELDLSLNVAQNSEPNFATENKVSAKDDKRSNNNKKVVATKSVPKFSKATIRKCMKLNSDVHNVSADAVITVLRATEVFMENIIKNSYVVSLANNRKSVKVIHKLINTRIK